MCDRCATGETCVDDWLGDNAGRSAKKTSPGDCLGEPPLRKVRDAVLKKNGEPVLNVYKAAQVFMKYAGTPGPETDDYKSYMSGTAEQILELIVGHRASAICWSPNTVIVRNGDVDINIICPMCMAVLRSVEK